MDDTAHGTAKLRVLYLEDNPQDVELLRENLVDGGLDFDMDVATDREQYVSLLAGSHPDIILADYTLPDFNGLAALELALERCPDVPFVCVTGTIGEDRAVELLKRGATDFVLKDRMGRLVHAMRSALDSAEEHRLRRRSEALNRLLIENIVDVVWILDVMTHRFKYVSPSVERMRGYTVDEVMAQTLEDQVAPEAVDETVRALAERTRAFLEGDTSVVTQVDELDQPCKDGTTLPVEIVTTMRRSESGAIELIGVTRDISKRRKVELELADHRSHLERLVGERTRQLNETNLELEQTNAELAAANRELEEATHAKSAFLARMSHELRTPLNSIIGFSSVLASGKAGPLTEEQSAQIGMVNKSGVRLLALINDILDLSKIEAGGTEVHTGPVDAASVVKDVADLVGQLAAEKGIALRVELPDEPLVVETDKDKLRQILMNLAGNAVKFTDAGEVTMGVARADRGSLAFTVTDTGVGIPVSDLETIFDAFHQVERAPGATPVGTGLGLAISRDLARLLGGDIAVTSVEGEGSTFMLRIPG